MKNLLIVCIAGFILACTNESNEGAVKDSTIIEKDNTINRDTMTVPLDTMGAQHDSLHK